MVGVDLEVGLDLGLGLRRVGVDLGLRRVDLGRVIWRVVRMKDGYKKALQMNV